MVKHYRTLAVESKTLAFLDDCELIYRQHHPELRDVVLTKSKILKEVMRFYLQKTARRIDDDE